MRSLAIGWSTIIQGMCFSCTEYAVVGLPVVGLSDGPQSSKGCVSPTLNMQLSICLLLAHRTVNNLPRDAFFYTEYTVIGLLVINLSDGLQSSKGIVYFALSMQLSVFLLLAYKTVYNHPGNAFLLHQ